MALVDSIHTDALSRADSYASTMNSLSDMSMVQAWEPVNWFAEWSAPAYIDGPTSFASFWTGYAAPATEIHATLPNAPTISEITVPSFGNAPEFLMAEPVINIPDAPSAALPSAPGNAPDFTAPTLPATPTISLPAVPSFSNVVVPDLPAVEYPTFTSSLPVEDIAAPSEVFSYAEEPYESALLDELKAKLMNDLINGGYGLDTGDESRLWERAAERELVNTEVAIQEATRQHAARGFALPPGALNASIEQARNTALEKNSSLSRDIMVKKADLYAEHRKFTIDQVRQVEQMMITYFGYAAERALNAAKSLVELSIAVFNARVAKYNVKLETYKAAAQVYSELIRAATLKLEAYKAQVEGAKLTMEAQRIHAEVYKTQLDGVQALINVYATQVQAARTVADIEKLKLDAFRSKVDAYAAQVGAKTAEFGMFESRIKGETAKLGVYQASAQTYATKVEAYRTKAQAAEVVTRAQVSANQVQLDKYRTDIQRYSTDIQKAQALLQAQVQTFEANVRSYAAHGDIETRKSQQTIEAAKANADVAVSYANVIMSNTVHGAQVLATKASAGANTLASLTHAYGTAAASALSAATGLVTAS